MPTDHRCRLHNDRTRLPILPDRRQPGPKEPISGRQFRSFHRPLQNAELVTKGKNLKLKRRAIAKGSQESHRQRNQGRRTSESKEGRQPPISQQLRGLREPQGIWHSHQRGWFVSAYRSGESGSRVQGGAPDQHRSGTRLCLSHTLTALQRFRAFGAARRTINGHEALHMMRKGQVRWLPGHNVQPQMQFVAQLFDFST